MARKEETMYAWTGISVVLAVLAIGGCIIAGDKIGRGIDEFFELIDE